MKWKNLSGEERYRVVEMARKGEVPIKELCKTFGMSRQTLNMAMEKVDRAAMQALEPKSPGRKGRSKKDVQIAQVSKEKASLEKDLVHWKQKYEVAMTFVDLHRKILNGEQLPGEEESPIKKTRRDRKGTRSHGRNRAQAKMVSRDDGTDHGSEDGEP